jgi:hypothetical protein
MPKLTAKTLTDEQIRELKRDPSTPDDIRHACVGALLPAWGREEANLQHRATIADFLNHRSPFLDLESVAASLTDPQVELLVKLVEGNPAGIYIYGSQVRTARSLEALKLVYLEDDGLAPMGGNRDGERWSITLVNRSRCMMILDARKGRL